MRVYCVVTCVVQAINVDIMIAIAGAAMALIVGSLCSAGNSAPYVAIPVAGRCRLLPMFSPALPLLLPRPVPIHSKSKRENERPAKELCLVSIMSQG